MNLHSKENKADMKRFFRNESILPGVAGRENFVKLKRTQLLYLVIKLKKLLLYERFVRDVKLREVSVSYFFVLLTTMMLSEIFSEALMSVYK